MSAELRRRAEEIFVEALEKPAGERKPFVESRCDGHPALLAEVRALLALATQAGDGFLNPEEIHQLTAGGSGLEGPLPDEPMLPDGTRVGGYTIRSVLGAGGMGLVYLAEQERPKRTVALKLIRRGYGARSILRRFEHEAEVLGLLQHPGIAQIYEAGTAQVGGVAQPFISMEYIRGSTLTAYAREHALGTRDQLALMMRVCDAVHHAHQRGIIHRDLKPGNILVDHAGQPKILDFGVARALHSDIRVTTMRTSIGQLIGTLAYMSPEQVMGDPAGIDTRSDVYALGVMLYELLTGRLPHDLASRSLPEAARAIRQDPPTKLSHVSRVFRGEIDTIVSKALEKDKDRRYQSAADLGEDIRRHLAGEPIHARQDSAWYLLRSQIRRHRWAFTGAAAALVGLVSFAVYAGFRAQVEQRLARAASDAQRIAIRERDRANQTTEQLQDELSYAEIERGRLEAAAGNLSLAEDHLWRAYLESPDRPAARWGLWEMYRRAPSLWAAPAFEPMVAGAVTPDRRFLVEGIRYGAVIWYDTATGKEAGRIRSLGAQVVSLAVSPVENLVALGMHNGGTLLTALDQHAKPRALEDPGTNFVFAVAFSADGRQVASGGEDKLVRVWDVATGRLIRKWEAHEQGTTGIAFSPDGKRLATGARLFRDGIGVRTWSLEDGAKLDEFPLTTQWITGLVYLTDPEMLLVGTRDGTLLRPTHEPPGAIVVAKCDNGVGPPLLSPDGTRLLVAGGDVLHILDRHDLSVVRSMSRMPQYIVGCGWADDNTIVAALNGSSVRAIDAAPEPELRRVGGFLTWCFGVQFSPDGRSLAVGATGEVRMIDAASLATTWSVPPIEGNAMTRTRAVRFFADSATVAAGSSDGVVKILDARTGATLASLACNEPEIFSIVLTKDEKTLAVSHSSGIIALWDVPSRTLIGKLPRLPRRIEGMALSPDGATLISSGAPGAVQVWDIASRSAKGRLPASGDVWGLAYSPDGGSLLATSYDGTIDIFDPATGERRKSIQGHGRLVPALAFSPDGNYFATGAEDGAVKLWEAATSRVLLALESGLNEVVQVCFDPTSRYLAAASSRRTVVIYDLKALDHCIEGNIEYQRKRLRPNPPAAK